ncbi:hypothetical protein VTN77DRAFT_2237 [Rasamsonia byssochlamydoides]|uniref:uncharacterized protein n=1 Tax=Rasamsonia byssochlamydoides TaxID=89139 RepID=UPI0037449A3E
MEFLDKLLRRPVTAENHPLSPSSSHTSPACGQAATARLTSVMVANPFQCPRGNTVKELASIVDSERVAHVRGTPASGKSILARLLHEHYRRGHTIGSVLYMAKWTVHQHPC